MAADLNREARKLAPVGPFEISHMGAGILSALQRPRVFCAGADRSAREAQWVFDVTAMAITNRYLGRLELP